MNPFQLISKYILGKPNRDEYEALESWKNESEANLEALKQTIRINEVSNDLREYQQVDKKAAWQKVDERIGAETPIVGFKHWGKIAAVAVLILASIFVIQSGDDVITPEAKVYTATGEQIKLDDGSIIDLDQKSVLTASQSRTVKLSGRAYFDIAPDKTKPFTIETNHGIVTVLGTEFNITTDSLFSQIYVTEGRVKHTYNGEEYILTVGDMLTIIGDKVELTKDQTSQVTAWKSKELNFINENLHNVMKGIGSFYNVQVEFPTKMNDDDCKINTKYTSETLDQVLQELAVIVRLKYEIINGKVIVKSFKC